MMATTHRLGGIAAGAAVTSLLHPGVTGTLIIFIGALVGSIFPDIDNRNSRISRKMPVTAMVVTLGQWLIHMISAFLPKKQKSFVRSLAGHRGITHSLMGSMIFPAIICIIGILLEQKMNLWLLAAVGIFVGCLSHLLLDMLSGGVPLFMPFSTGRVRISNIKTGGFTEWLFRMIFVVIMIFSCLNQK